MHPAWVNNYLICLHTESAHVTVVVVQAKDNYKGFKVTYIDSLPSITYKFIIYLGTSVAQLVSGYRSAVAQESLP